MKGREKTYRFLERACLAALDEGDYGLASRIAGELCRFPADVGRRGVEQDGFVYYVLARASLQVKIGWMREHPAKRLSQLQVGSPVPLELVAFEPGTKSLERERHQQFRSQQLAGEWFRHSKELEALMVSLLESVK